jgi:hypothetical protein
MLMALGLSLLVGCQPQAGTPMTLGGVTLLRYGPDANAGTAHFQGTLRFRDGCIWVDPDAGAGAVVAWPPQARLEEVAGTLHVALGEQRLADGDRVSIGARPIIGPDRVREAESVVGPLPPGCAAADSYAVVSSVSIAPG